MGLVPAARDRVDETTDGAAHDERRDHQGVSMPRRARPGRQLGSPQRMLRRQSACGVCWVPCVAMAGSQAWPVVMTACRCRRIAAPGPGWQMCGCAGLPVVPSVDSPRGVGSLVRQLPKMPLTGGVRQSRASGGEGTRCVTSFGDIRTSRGLVSVPAAAVGADSPVIGAGRTGCAGCG
jgi:hypothetical protein